MKSVEQLMDEFRDGTLTFPDLADALKGRPWPLPKAQRRDDSMDELHQRVADQVWESDRDPNSFFPVEAGYYLFTDAQRQQLDAQHRADLRQQHPNL